MLLIGVYRYLFEYNKWSECQEPQNIVQWNVTLFSILLVLGGIEFILCFIQIINGIIGGLCGLCCRHEEVRNLQIYPCFSDEYETCYLHYCGVLLSSYFIGNLKPQFPVQLFL